MVLSDASSLYLVRLQDALYRFAGTLDYSQRKVNEIADEMGIEEFDTTTYRLLREELVVRHQLAQ